MSLTQRRLISRRFPLRGALALAVACFLVNSCASATKVANVSTVENNLAKLENTEPWRRECKVKGIRSPEAEKADSLAFIAVARAAEGDTEEAYWMSVAAIAYFRLALANYSLTQNQLIVEQLRSSLAAVEKQLGTYKEIVSELSK